MGLLTEKNFTLQKRKYHPIIEIHENEYDTYKLKLRQLMNFIKVNPYCFRSEGYYLYAKKPIYQAAVGKMLNSLKLPNFPKILGVVTTKYVLGNRIPYRDDKSLRYLLVENVKGTTLKSQIYNGLCSKTRI